MRRTLLLLTMLVASQNSHARDEGYALECNSQSDRQNKLVSYLETDVDKTVNLLDNGSFTFWDTHEWFADVIVVHSFSQAKTEKKPRLTAAVLIQRDSLEAVLVAMGDQTAATKLQCELWAPASRNK